MKPTAPENFDGNAITDRLDTTWKAQVNLSRLDPPDFQVYVQELTTQPEVKPTTSQS